mmetsp:Transcript_17567/g.29653  ORF Transcript_17567/g.29653 Transcript_17567/m.29653 type:complete len:106 (-) Transcript_17567:416-733(-)
MTDQSGEIFRDLRLVVNNVGYLKLGNVLTQDPADLQTMLKVNLYPITLLTRMAASTWRQLAKVDAEKRYGLVQVSSFSSLRPYVGASVYGGCKRYDSKLGEVMQQ